jgi:hypothetical protein
MSKMNANASLKKDAKATNTLSGQSYIYIFKLPALRMCLSLSFFVLHTYKYVCTQQLVYVHTYLTSDPSFIS